MKKYKTIMICDVCKKKVTKNHLISNHKLLYLLFFTSYNFIQWAIEFNNKVNGDVVCYDCANSFRKWVKVRQSQLSRKTEGNNGL